MQQESTNINATCSEGFTALHWACMRRDETLINQLIAQGADFNLPNKSGRTALDYYCYQIRADDFKAILDSGEYRNLKKEGILISGVVEMPEFSLVYWNDSAIEIGATRRNTRPLKMEMFTAIKEAGTADIAPQAVTTSKPFIRSPVFSAKESQSGDHVIDSQPYKKN